MFLLGWLRIIPMQNKDSDTCIKSFKDMLSKNNVKPISILYDNEPAFLTDDFLNTMM